MSDPAYVRTSGARNKINRRRQEMIRLMDWSVVNSRGVRYIRAEDGAIVRMKVSPTENGKNHG